MRQAKSSDGERFEGKEEVKLSAQAKREVIQRMVPRYQQASAPYKEGLLDEVVEITGYARRSAVRLLNHPPQEARPRKRRRQARYGAEVQRILSLLWHRANRICTILFLATTPLTRGRDTEPRLQYLCYATAFWS